MKRLALASIVLVFTCATVSVAQKTYKKTYNYGEQLPQTAIRKSPTQILTVKVYEKNAQDKERILANPTINAVVDREFTFVAGGEIPDTQPLLTYGTTVSGTIGNNVESKISLSLRISVGEQIPSDAPDFDAVKSQSVDLRGKIAANETKTIQLGEDLWCDLTIE